MNAIASSATQGVERLARIADRLDGSGDPSMRIVARAVRGFAGIMIDEHAEAVAEAARVRTFLDPDVDQMVIELLNADGDLTWAISGDLDRWRR